MSRWTDNPRVRMAGGALAVALVTGATLPLVVRGLQVSHATTVRGGRDLVPTRLFAQSRAATVLISATYRAQVQAPTPVVDRQRLFDELSAEIDRGDIADDQESVTMRAVELIATDPIGYVLPADPPRVKDIKTGVLGSGFILTSDGYVVTNAHVAAQSDHTVQQSVLEAGLAQFVPDPGQNLIGSLHLDGIQLPADLAKQLQNGEVQWLQHYLRSGEVHRTLAVVSDAKAPGLSTTFRPFISTLVTAGEPTPGKDVAIIKMEGENLPTLSLGDDHAARPGDRLYVMGYPGSVTMSQVLSAETALEPSLSSGTLSAKRQAAAGFEVIQTDATVNHGNSGGPVLDSRGDVVGIATFGSIDVGTGEQLSGLNFIMPASLIQEFVGRSGAHPAPSAFSRDLERGLDDEEQGFYRDALGVFQTLNTVAPGHPDIQQHITADMSAIAAGKDVSGRNPVLVLGALAADAAVSLAVLVLLRRRRRPPEADASRRSEPADGEGLQAA